VAAQAEAAESAAAQQKLRAALKEAEEAQLESAAAARKLRTERDTLEAVGGGVGSPGYHFVHMRGCEVRVAGARYTSRTGRMRQGG
jgi:hypothetical protein